MKDYYSILGVPHDATPEQIKEAYRILAKVWHPDRFGGQHEEKVRKFAEERFKEVNEAYEVLSDPVKRAAYDQEFIVPKPKPVVSPTRIDFGKAKKGEVVRRSFQIDNQGGSPSKVDIDYPPDSWFQVRVRSVSDETFPLEVEVIVDAETLKEGEYAGKVTVSLDGEKAEVELFLKVEAVRVRKPSPAPTWSASPVTTSAPGPAWADFLMFNWLVPTGPIDGLAGCLTFIFLFIFAAILSITIGIPLWLIKKGWDRWQQGDKVGALTTLSVVGVTFLVVAGVYWNNEQQEELWLRQREEARAAWEAEVARVLQNPAAAVTLTRVTSDASAWCESNSTPEWCGRWRFAQYTITNHTKLRLDRTSSNLPAGDYCNTRWARTFETLEPGETRTIYCPTGYKFWEWEYYPPICLYLVNRGSYEKRFGYTTLVVCDGQSTIVTTS